jgi:hypothetical protein
LKPANHHAVPAAIAAPTRVTGATVARREHNGAMRRAMAGVVTVAVVAAALGCSRQDPIEELYAERYQAMTGMEDALREAGSATVEFDVRLRSWLGFEAVHWRGTTQIQYGEPPVSQTQFEAFEMTVPEPTLENLSQTGTERYDLTEISTGGTRYHRSTSLDLPADRPWLQLDPGESYKYGTHAALIADPDLGLVDLAFYTGLAGGVSEAHAFSAATDEEETVDGVHTRMYLLNCFPWPDSDFCSQPDNAQPLLEAFPGTNSFLVTYRLDDEGRPRRIEFEDIRLDTGAPLPGDNGATVMYQARGEMTITGFGEPVDVSVPPANQVTTRQ